MTFSLPLITLGKYLAGEFDNRQQALEQPAWYVHLKLWIRPVAIFTTDSITLFAEQANIVNLNQPYRPRILRLREKENIQVEYYMFRDLAKARGGGQNKHLLSEITPKDLEFLPNCTLQVQVEPANGGGYLFKTYPARDTPCSFCYQGNTYQVFLGFSATANELKTDDKGIDPETGAATWGALMGSYCFTKREDFSAELSI